MTRSRALIFLGIPTVALDVVILLLDRRMQNTGGPGILGLEFAASKSHSSQILSEWGSTGKDAARLSLWIDFAFMLSYGSFFTLSGLAVRDLARRWDWRRLAAAGRIVPWFAAAAASFDACENINLLLVVDGKGGEISPLIATICASAKFLLIGLAIAYVVLGLARRAGIWLRSA